MSKCEIESCDMYAEYYDVMHNKICASCMEQEINDDGTIPEDYETIEDCE